MTKYLSDSKITNAVINKTTDNVSRNSEDEDKQLIEKKMYLYKNEKFERKINISFREAYFYKMN